MIDEELRAIFPDAPAVLLDLVAARVLLGRVLRGYNAAACAFDDATRAYVAIPRTRLERLEAAVVVERARVELERWSDLLLAWRKVHHAHTFPPRPATGEMVGGVAMVFAIRRARYAAWKARRARRAELAGLPPPPAYVLPEARGDAFEITPDPSNFATMKIRGPDAPPFLVAARATLRIWSRYYAVARAT